MPLGSSMPALQQLLCSPGTVHGQWAVIFHDGIGSGIVGVLSVQKSSAHHHAKLTECMVRAVQLASLMALLMAWLFIFDTAQKERASLEDHKEGMVGTQRQPADVEMGGAVNGGRSADSAGHSVAMPDPEAAVNQPGNRMPNVYGEVTGVLLPAGLYGMALHGGVAPGLPSGRSAAGGGQYLCSKMFTPAFFPALCLVDQHCHMQSASSPCNLLCRTDPARHQLQHWVITFSQFTALTAASGRIRCALPLSFNSRH